MAETTVTWAKLIQPEWSGRLGLALNEYGTEVTVMVCESCGSIFTVTGDQSLETWGGAVCLAETCDSYDVDRDVDLMFEIEPWRIQRDEGRRDG